MNAVTKLRPEAEVVDPLAKMREPFPDHQISKLPKETKTQADQRKADQDKGNWPAICNVCGGRHHKSAVHLDYVGHAALTDRLLDADPHWSWEPVAYRDGLPAFDGTGGLWIKLTVGGVTRLGYGHAAAKPQMDAGSREKEVIGDALRNAAMRFGAALDLWHKGLLHADDGEGETIAPNAEQAAINLLRGSADAAWFKEAWSKNFEGWKKVLSAESYARVLAVKNEMVAKFIAETEAAKKRETAAQKPIENFTRGGGGQPMDPNDPFDDQIPFISRGGVQ